ncbi:hypothetical protein QQS21_007994 [Conoideocrella luteorostrata]|uniref:O-methyltransferase C-terminal domain-containing protein n=1 Tax=Conoideocrella luteorostrata TaxID=1105319 RepID=A0AAJ0CM10_9HYPO|nr:hypothetical protein QQS21_007994 [Conoideocrella luteorostrata]
MVTQSQADAKGAAEQPTAASPANDLNLNVLIEQLELLNANPEALAAADAETARQRILQLTRAVAVAIEEPFEAVQRLAYSPLPLITARVAQQHHIFATLVSAKKPVPFATLQNATKLDESILESILDYLGTQAMVNELTPGIFTATKLSNMMVVPLFQDAVTHFHDNCLPGFAALNSVLSQPEAKLNAFKTGQHTDQDFYTWMETHPVQQGAFHRFMEAQFASLPTWLDVVDFETEFCKYNSQSDVAFVDVGGGNGQQCIALKEKFPHMPGRIINQDTPDVLSKALFADRVEKLSYDYFTEQRVKNARVYYFRQIMHNNDDEACIRILQSQIPAMGPDSVIIIDDKTLPDDKPPQGTPGVEYTAGLSIAMKVMFDAQERRETHWRELLSKAGLAIKGIRKFTKFHDSVIIAMKSETLFCS